MAIEIVMPRLGWDMKAGTVVEWRKHDGDRVEAGEYLFLVESDKSTTEVEALDSGMLHIPDQSLHLGEELPVGTLLAYLLEDGERLPVTDNTAESPSSPSAVPELVVPDGRAAEEASAPTEGGDADRDRSRRRRHPVASPRAKRLAAEQGVDWTTLTGSSRSGRIVARDVQVAVRRTRVVANTPITPAPDISAPLGAASAAAIPLTSMRRVIGERMARSAHTTAAVTLTTEADASALARVRADLVEALAGQDTPVPAYNDFFIRLVAVALREFPDLNAALTDEGIVRHEAVNIGLAVDTEWGLFVPVVRDAQARSVRAIAEESARLIAAVRAGQASSADLADGGTFTITNLGMYEIDAFTPIINPPQCAILGLGRIVARPMVVDEDAGTIAVCKMLALSLTFDHRLVDGGPAARFLQRIKQFVERPVVWLTA